ncbi:PREDICTED: abietadienol/abietadienal oxidase isoform X1 [Erythranthe guttata]|uniref:abietadienol/abietadienal oxidase isoform X1 n=1 Tax=Erythranthe guttata TaxID=4155 RepID=UPI00064D73E5|nr:PREDICTED: abietadienol/abietadienal oxidase isoform X1 [Erythranthe guttata]|eukprot:XP_012855758.1 PREDICTED: abietadienol/abietadienal oxidase isoform X1 [Erythranthe guttata]
MTQNFDSRAWPYIIIISSLLLVFAFLAKKNKKSATYSKLPPGRRGWPIIGDSISWYNAVASSHPPAFVEKQVQRFGKIFSCSLFGKWAVVSADPAFNRFVMQNEGKLFQSSYPKSFRDVVGKNGVITAQGDQQRKLHSIASNMMRLDKLKFHFLHDIQIVIKQIITNLHHNQVVLLQDVCRKVAINLMANQLLGVSSESEVNEIAQSFSDFADGCLSVPIKLPGFAYSKAMKARESIISKIKRTMENHRVGKSCPEIGNGVLGRLLDEESLPDEAVGDFMINLLFAGNETTAKTMLFSVYFLTQCPRAMAQLMVFSIYTANININSSKTCTLALICLVPRKQDEQQKLRSESGEMLTWQDYKSMPFTQCVIDEALRLGGIAIWLLREAKEEVEYQGKYSTFTMTRYSTTILKIEFDSCADYVIPKGSFVVPFLSAVHLSENLYEDALCFNPWRWMEPENEEKRNWRSGQYFAPFGGGSRFCPGAELARLQIALFLHYFLTTFRWKQLKEDKMSFFPSARLVNGFQIQLTKINS